MPLNDLAILSELKPAREFGKSQESAARRKK
jgi:hypothetical protein